MLACIVRDPGTRLRDLAQHTGLTERAVSHIVSELAEEGYLTKHHLGARNFYEVHPERPLRGANGDGHQIGELLRLMLRANGDEKAEPTS